MKVFVAGGSGAIGVPLVRGIRDIVDDRPLSFSERVARSPGPADLRWPPRFPTIREGLGAILDRAA
jgi:hypothetical protein